MINKAHFGKRIACLRKNLGLSQVELAEMLGVTSQAVSKWECGYGERGTGTKAKALKEAYRVLKPGGILITATGFVNRETLSTLPMDAQKVLTEKRPDVSEDLYEDTVLAGFSKVDSIISGSWYTDDDESTIADLARSLGINLKFTSYIRYCTKE